MDRVRLSQSQWTSIGDVGNALLVISSLSYAYAVLILDGDDDSVSSNSIQMSPDWRRDGFCINTIHEKSWTTHELACGVNLILGVCLIALYMTCGKSTNMEYANQYALFFAFGMMGHGLAHGYLGHRLQSFESMQGLVETVRLSQQTNFVRNDLPMAILVWFPLLQATMPDTRSIWVFVVSFLVKRIQTFVPLRFIFGYVQTILVAFFALDQCLKPSKKRPGFRYATLVWIPGLIPSVMAWWESTHCEFVRKHLYGHVLYDASLAICFIVWYLLCYLTRRQARDVIVVKEGGEALLQSSSQKSVLLSGC